MDSSNKVVDFDLLKRISQLESELAESIKTKRLIEEERDLGIMLSQAHDLKETLYLCLSSAMRISDLDCGGVYTVNPENGNFDLVFHVGLSDNFVAVTSHYSADSMNARLISEGVPIYTTHEQILAHPNQSLIEEGLKALAVLPVVHQHQLVACLNLASHRFGTISDFAKTGLESIARHIGASILQARREEDTRQSYKNLKTLFDSVGDFLFVLGPEGEILDTNAVVRERLGYGEEELFKLHVQYVHPADRRERAMRTVAAMLDGKAEYCPIPLLARNGSEIPVETRVVRGIWNGRPALFGISRDISKRLKDEESIRRLNSEQKLLLDNIKTQVWYLVSTEQYGKVNRAHAEFVGHPSGEIEDKSLWELFPPDVALVCKNSNELVFTKREAVQTEEWVPNSTGEPRLLSIVKTPTLFDDGTVESVVCSAEDITLRKLAEQNVRKKSELISLLVDLSVMFISLNVDRLDSGLDLMLQNLGKFFNADRSYLFLIDGKTVSNTHEWCAPGITSEKGNLQKLPVSMIPWWIRKLRNRQTIVIGDLEELPAEADNEKQLLKSQNIQSVLVAPVFNGYDLAGFLGFDAVKFRVQWPVEASDLLKVTAEMISNVFQKKQKGIEIARANESLRESEASLTQMLNTLPLGIAKIDNDLTVHYANQNLASIVGLDAGDIEGRQIQSILSIPEENLRNIAAIARDEAPSGGVSNRIQAVNLNGRRLWFQINMIKGFAMSQFNLLLLQDITELMDLRLIRGKARNFHGLLYQSEEMETLVDRLKVMARTDLPVFIHGETGTGKEMVARAIHAESLRSGNPFIAINCAGLADSLLNSQLFGHRRGSFTGAIADQKGYFELADGGTLFLDEIADASPDVQKSILRVLEDGVLYPVGSPHPVKVSVRVIAATNIDIQSADKLAELRADLFYRLSAVKAFLPPLRRRPDDIPMLAEYFLRGLCNTTGASKSVLLSKDAFARLLRYPWPGNVRELKNAITVAYFSIKEGVIDAADLPAEPLQWAYVGSEANRLVISAENRGANDAVDEKSALLQTLSDCGGNRSKACEKLGLSRSTFYRRLRKYGLG